MLPVAQRWWEGGAVGLVPAAAFMVSNLVYVVLGVAGAGRLRPGPVLLLAGFVVARSAFLGTLDNPEPRYTLECFPVVLALGAVAISRRWHRDSRRRAGMLQSGRAEWIAIPPGDQTRGIVPTPIQSCSVRPGGSHRAAYRCRPARFRCG